MRLALCLALAGFLSPPVLAAPLAADAPTAEIRQANPCNPRIRPCR